MKMIIHRADDRGFFDHGWLQTFHTFSFARFYDPQRIHFGALRVLNDDTVAPNEGFGTHPHDNMEVISNRSSKNSNRSSTGLRIFRARIEKVHYLCDMGDLKTQIA